jgi:transcriptional regulator with XRE-family HTH domain
VGRWTAAEQPELGFAELLRQLQTEAGLTQEGLAEAAGLSPRSVSDLERGINRTARQDTAVLLISALGLAGAAGELFVAAASGKAPALAVLAAIRRAEPGASAAAIQGRPRDIGKAIGNQADLDRLMRAVIDSPYRGLKAFQEQDAALLFRPGSGHGRAAGPDVAAGGMHWAAGGLGRVGRGQVVPAARGGAAADPEEWAGGRAAGGDLAVPGVHPDRGSVG